MPLHPCRFPRAPGALRCTEPEVDLILRALRQTTVGDERHGGGVHLAPASLVARGRPTFPPVACESALQRGRRAIWGGRGDARAMPFLAAQSAARWNPPLRLFYERLVSRGKSKKAALAAVARKLLIAINAMMRDQLPWQPAIVAEPSCC